MEKCNEYMLEQIFYDRPLYESQILAKREELSVIHYNDDTSGIKSSFISNPTERLAIKLGDNPYIKTRELYIKGVDYVYNQQSDIGKKIIHQKFWSDDNYISWQDCGESNGLSKQNTKRLRENLLKQLGQAIGWI